MHNKIIFEFRSGDRSLLFDGTIYGILSYEGLEATEYDLQTVQNINSAGATMQRKKILERPISIEFEYSGNDKVNKRQELIGFFSPYRSGDLMVTYLGVQRRIEYEVSEFKIKNSNIFEPMECLLELSCLDPAFKDILQTGERISTWVRGLRFKFALPFKLKEKGETKKVIVNTGHVEAPVEIEFHGPAVNPRIDNLSTGEFIRIKRELTSDDTLYINTAFGKKTVEIVREDTREDAFNYIDLESSFFALQVGDNVIEYSCENGLDPQSVELYYYNRYIGV